MRSALISSKLVYLVSALGLVVLLGSSREIWAEATEKESGLYLANGAEVPLSNWSTEMAVRISIRKPNGVSTCSGTVVGPTAVLTAAHCLVGARGPGDVEVHWRTGDQVAVVWYNYYAVDHDVQKNYFNDLALLQLAAQPPMGIKRRAVLTESDLPGGYVSAYGRTENNRIGELRQAFFKCLFSNSGSLYQCQGSAPGSFDLQAYARGGDSGAGMMFWDQANDRMIVNAVVTRSSDKPNTTLVVPIRYVRDRIKYLNSNCRLFIFGLPCP